MDGDVRGLLRAEREEVLGVNVSPHRPDARDSAWWPKFDESTIGFAHPSPYVVRYWRLDEPDIWTEYERCEVDRCTTHNRRIARLVRCTPQRWPHYLDRVLHNDDWPGLICGADL